MLKTIDYSNEDEFKEIQTKIAIEVFMENADTIHISEQIKIASQQAEKAANDYLQAETSSDAEMLMTQFKNYKYIHDNLLEIYEKRNKKS